MPAPTPTAIAAQRRGARFSGFLALREDRRGTALSFQQSAESDNTCYELIISQHGFDWEIPRTISPFVFDGATQKLGALLPLEQPIAHLVCQRLTSLSTDHCLAAFVEA